MSPPGLGRADRTERPWRPSLTARRWAGHGLWNRHGRWSSGGSLSEARRLAARADRQRRVVLTVAVVEGISGLPERQKRTETMQTHVPPTRRVTSGRLRAFSPPTFLKETG